MGAGRGGSECGGGCGSAIPVCVQWTARGACFSLGVATGGRWEHTEQGLVVLQGGAGLQMKPARPAWGRAEERQAGGRVEWCRAAED